MRYVAGQITFADVLSNHGYEAGDLARLFYDAGTGVIDFTAAIGDVFARLDDFKGWGEQAWGQRGWGDSALAIEISLAILTPDLYKFGLVAFDGVGNKTTAGIVEYDRYVSLTPAPPRAPSGLTQAAGPGSALHLAVA